MQKYNASPQISGSQSVAAYETQGRHLKNNLCFIDTQILF